MPRDLFNREGTGHITGKHVIGVIWASALGVLLFLGFIAAAHAR